MALCESQLDLMMQLQDSPRETSSPDKKVKEPNGDIYGLDKGPPLPMSVDYRSPVSHFIPPAVELYAARHKPEINVVPPATPPAKRKRGRPRIDKTSPEYLANVAARKQAKEMAAVMSVNSPSDSGEKRKRGRPRVDKTSPEYLARKRARELEALERKAKKEYRRRTTADSAASSSAGESTPRVKRKYTKRAPSTKKDGNSSTERVKGKRGRPRKIDQTSVKNPQEGKIRVRSNLMPSNTEPIPVDSDDEPDLGSPSQASDSLSLDENLRALRHIHEKYANIDKDDLYESHLLAVNFKKPPMEQRLARDDDDVLSVRSSEGGASVKDLNTRVEKLEDSSNSDSDSSSESGSSSSGSSSSSSSDSSSSSSSDSENETETGPATGTETHPHTPVEGVNDDRSFGAWSYGPETNTESNSDSESDPERARALPPPPTANDEISESDNESADKSFQCHVCRKWYSTRVTLKIHRRVHQNRGGGGGRSRARSADRYECDCCSETFARRERLAQHKAEAHRGSMTVRCEVCRKCFEDEHELARHDSAHTADERAGRCSLCGLVFPRYELLRRHRGAAHPPPARLPHACHQCGKRFSHAHSLSRHMHNHAKQLYRCVVCKASFARADQLAQHLNSHLANYKRLKR